MKSFNRLASSALLLTLLSSTAMAQGYYDDDIYFDESKARKEKAEKKQDKRHSAQPTSTYTRVASIPATAVTTAARPERDDDEYNRRGAYAPVKQQGDDSFLGDNFEYTKRIERFSDPDIVTSADDETLAYLYTNADDELANINYATSPTTVNIYVENPDPWDTFWNPYYYSSAWSWAWGPRYYYNPWYSWNYAWGYGPSWSWNWGWGGPSFSYTWGWGYPYYPSYGWSWTYPGHHHKPHAPKPPHNSYPGNHWASRPTSSGAYRPARPTASGSSLRNDKSSAGTRPGRGVLTGTDTHRPSTGSSQAGRRPSQSATGNANRNPGSVMTGTSTGTATGTVTGRGGTRRSTYNGSATSTTRTSSSSTPSRSSSSSTRSSSGSSSRSSYGSSSGSSSRSSSGSSYSGGSGRSSSGGSSSGRSGGGGRGGRH